MWKHRKQLGDLLEQSLFDLNLGAKEVAVVKTSDLAIDAFRKIVDKKISAVGVVNHEGVLVGNVSARDLRVRLRLRLRLSEDFFVFIFTFIFPWPRMWKWEF